MFLPVDVVDYRISYRFDSEEKHGNEMREIRENQKNRVQRSLSLTCGSFDGVDLNY